MTAGTIFDKTRSPLPQWFAAAWYVCGTKNGASALGLQRLLGMGSYETAWTWLHKLRRAMVIPGRDLLSGDVEVDETYVGGVDPDVHGRRIAKKALVAVGAERRGKGAGRIRLARIPDATKQSLHGFVTASIEPGSTLFIDGWPSYATIAQHGYDHRPVSIRASVEDASTLLKRWLLGTHQGAVQPAQLDYYLDEFTFRFNRRDSRSRGLLFYRLLHQAVRTEPHPYGAIARLGTRPSQPRVGGAKGIALSLK